MTKLAPSIMAGNHLDFQGELQLIEKYADVVHLDVMDGHFVPNLGLCIRTCEYLCKSAKIPCWAHLMVTNPQDYVKRFGNMKSTAFVWHIECDINHMRMIEETKGLDMLAGVAISPATDVSKLKDVSKEVDIITVMGVVPGRSGQKFIPETFTRVKEIRSLPGSFVLEVDGGVNMENVQKLVYSGADVLVSGSSFFNSDDERKKRLSNFVRSLRR